MYTSVAGESMAVIRNLSENLKCTLMAGWALVSMLALYPAYLVKNIGYALRAPSVLLYAIICFGLDRISKYLIQAGVYSLPIPIVKNFFTLTFVRNPGVAFGWFPDWRLPPILMAFVMIAIITYYTFQLPANERLTRWSLALLVGGAMGNLYDRVVYGYVVDFFLFHIGSIDFPVFNVADIAIDVGVALLFIDIFFFGTEESSESAPPSDPTNRAGPTDPVPMSV
ncbi:MAG: signal peptidase II [Candidatus Riflebacteria bacterium]|nr:signal peptidase II [Candidatus Riflebacteria bacterium]